MLLADIGNYALIAAFAFACAAIVASLAGARLMDTRLLAIGERSVYAVFFLVTLSIGTLWALLLNDQFAVRYVYGHSSEALPLHFKIGSLWSGQEGSLLLWTFVLAGCSALAVFTQRHRHNRLPPERAPQVVDRLRRRRVRRSVEIARAFAQKGQPLHRRVRQQHEKPNLDRRWRAPDQVL